MMNRKPNEVLVSVELMEQLLREGLPRTYRVEHRPAPEARIVNVRWAGSWIVPTLRVVYATGGIVKPGVYLAGESGPEQIS